MALVEQESTPITSVQVPGSRESHGSRVDFLGQGSAKLGRWLERARANVWAPVALRALGITLGMLGLATIGALATARGAPGHALTPAEERAPQALRVEASLATGAAGSHKASPKTAASSTSAPASRDKSPAITEDGRVILNLATVDDLRHLPGVGRKRAESILELREKLGGRFRRLSDLLRIRGIGTRRLKQLAPLVLLDPPAVKAASSASSVPAPPPAPGL